MCTGQWVFGNEKYKVDVILMHQKLYRDQIMFAEWLMDIPEDLYENWCVVSCPVGKRCLVISANGMCGRNGL